tara:strand:+ start:488 stop:1795 length:1308 start_codon:yes stop_codon:yes gene_type:complete
MANTIIQIKRSTVTGTPVDGSLSISELAYSFNSDKLFIGNTTSGVTEIGGKTTVNKAIDAYNLAFNTGIGANAYTNTVAAAANSWANTVGLYANNYSNTTFVKLTAPSQTITGDISVTGNLNILGTSTTVSSQSLLVNDPVIVLANNNTTDVTDLGVVAPYLNATSVQVYTGLIRDPGTKQWHLFKEYNDQFFYNGNNIDLTGNNFTIDTLNANFVTSNLWLGGANAILSISTALTTGQAAFAKANNALKNTTDTFTGTLTITGDLVTTGNVTFDTNTLYVDATNNRVGISTTSPTSNLHVIGTANVSSNLVAGNVSVSGALVVSGQNILTAISNAEANAANASVLSTGTVPSARLSGSYTGITGLGTIATGLWQGGTVNVAYGGTGMVTFTTNGILYGDATGAIKVTAAGTDGQVLLADPTGIPVFSHLTGGTF